MGVTNEIKIAVALKDDVFHAQFHSTDIFFLLQSKIAGSGLRMTVIWGGEKSGRYK